MSQVKEEEEEESQREEVIFTHSFISVPLFHFIRLVSFCLLFLMAALQEEITALKEEIADYRQEYVNAAAGSEEKKGLPAAITERTKTLNALLQQLQQQQGEFVPVTSTSLL